MFERNWYAVSHPDIAQELAGGSDGGFTDSGTSWYGLSQRLLGATDAVRRATSTIGTTRSGAAADAAQGATRPLAPWINETEGIATSVGSVTYEQAKNLADTVARMPPPQPPAQMPTDWNSVLAQGEGGAVGQSIAADMQDRARLGAERQAQQMMADYQRFSDWRTQTLTGFDHPLDPRIPAPVPDAEPRPGGAGGDPAGGGREGDQGPGGGRGDRSGGPDGSRSPQGRPDGAPPPSPSATRTDTESTPPPGPSGPVPDGPGGAPAGPGAQLGPPPPTGNAPVPGVVPGTGGTSVDPDRPGGAGSRVPATTAPGPGGGSSDGRGASTSGGLGDLDTRGGSGRAGSVDTPLAPGAGAGSAVDGPNGGARALEPGGRVGVGGPILESAVGRAGGGAIGAVGEAGRGGGGVPFMPGGAGFGGSGGAGHRRPDYLEEDDPDAIAGVLPRVAPPVIGE